MAGRFLSPLRVEELADDRWRLIAPLRYQSDVLFARDPGYLGTAPGDVLEVPCGFLTDFASVPRVPFAYWLVGGVANRPAVVHDYLYQTHLRPREVCDNVFAEAMKADGVTAWRRGVMWSAVRAAGSGSYDSGPKRMKLLCNSCGA